MRLFLLGFLTLFQELILIRYLSGNIWNLGYFPNLVLLAVFMGMGIGFMFHRSWGEKYSDALLIASLCMFGGLLSLVTYYHPALPGFGEVEADFGGELFFTASESSSAVSYPQFILWFSSVVCMFSFLSQRTAKQFVRYAPLTAYTLDIAGSCSGVVAFMAVSGLALPAWAWIMLLIPPYLFLLSDLRWPGRLIGIATIVLTAGAVRNGDSRLSVDADFPHYLETHWSPYQKVEYIEGPGVPQNIFVNGISHQVMHSAEFIRDSFYRAPHTDRLDRQELSPYGRVLVIGAGSGNDVAAALISGATHVDAVEIDPAIAEVGRSHHPAQPYTDPRVEVVIDDARAFLTQTTEQYDLIVFALTDSLVKVSPMAQLRLENYLFTQEAVARAYEVLSPDGDLVLYNGYRKPWLSEKIAALLQNATGVEPRVIYRHGPFVMYKIHREPGDLPSQPTAAALSESAIEIPTDDWPFLYLQRRSVATVYQYAIAVLGVVNLALLLLFLRMVHRGESDAPQVRSLPTSLAFLLMGAAFLLLETKSIVQFSLLFGTTWLNNSLVFLAVLVLVLAANWLATLFPSRSSTTPVAVLLLASCIVGWLIPLSSLLYMEAELLRFVLASLLTFSPIFFANLLFSLVFREETAPDHMFGWNLIGANIGGLLEYTSTALGYSRLGLVVFALYALVLLCLALRKRGVS